MLSSIDVNAGTGSFNANGWHRMIKLDLTLTLTLAAISATIYDPGKR